jgi:NADH:ubiquinone oxidoreductase subunit F (NADH-binding)
VGVQQKMMRHADVATTMNIYGKGMMDSKLDAHTKLLVYAGVRICGVEAEVIDSMVGAEGFEPPTLCSQNAPKTGQTVY